MVNYICYNYAGEVMYHVYQWDTNLTISIFNIPIMEGSEVYFHFCNRLSKTAFVVQPTIDENDQTKYTAVIPNELTSQPETIFLYISERPVLDVNAVITDIKIPVIPRVMPEDYIYQPQDPIIYPRGLSMRDGEIILVDDNGNQIGDGVYVQGLNVEYDVKILLNNPTIDGYLFDGFQIIEE